MTKDSLTGIDTGSTRRDGFEPPTSPWDGVVTAASALYLAEPSCAGFMRTSIRAAESLGEE